MGGGKSKRQLGEIRERCESIAFVFDFRQGCGNLESFGKKLNVGALLRGAPPRDEGEKVWTTRDERLY